MYTVLNVWDILISVMNIHILVVGSHGYVFSYPHLLTYVSEFESNSCPIIYFGMIRRQSRYGSGNSTTASKVSGFQRLFPNLQLVDSRKGIWSPKIAPKPMDKQLPDGPLRATGHEEDR